ncbi:MAG: hypothetical protein IPN60_11810 [Saprospiraceae bacterium]|nr:hypothetical protein [Candidatus Opimibacter skivensis]
MIFGNWEVTSDSINWIGEPDSGYEIPINQLLELTGGEDEEFYDWLGT